MAGNEKLAIPYHDAADEIRDMIEKGRVLQNSVIEFEKDLEQSKVGYYSWSKENEEHLRRIFATDDEAKRYKENFALVLKRKIYLSDMVKDFRELVKSKVKHLEAIVNRLTIVTDIDFDIHHDEISYLSSTDNKAVVLHGSKKIRDFVAKVLEENQMEAVVLKDKSGVIDDFDNHEDAHHFIVILSNDDIGAAKSKINNLKPRARQNVILELGYILGKIGSGKVIILYENDVEIPSVLRGVTTLKLTGKSWQKKLAREIQKVDD